MGVRFSLASLFFNQLLTSLILSLFAVSSKVTVMISCQHSQKSRSIGNQLIACSDYLGTVKTSFLKGTSSISDEAELPDFARGDLGP